jgi:hypothetical protein
MTRISGHDVYGGLVVEAGWNLVSYKAWLFRTLFQQLLQRSRLTPKAYSDLSFAQAMEIWAASVYVASRRSTSLKVREVPEWARCVVTSQKRGHFASKQ